jgi:hypothetical protein
VKIRHLKRYFLGKSFYLHFISVYVTMAVEFVRNPKLVSTADTAGRLMQNSVQFAIVLSPVSPTSEQNCTRSDTCLQYAKRQLNGALQTFCFAYHFFRRNDLPLQRVTNIPLYFYSQLTICMTSDVRHGGSIREI